MAPRIASSTARWLCAGLGAFGLAGCTTITPTEDPVYLRLTDLEARLVRIERVFDNQSLIELSSQVDQLRAQAQALRGELETLRFETENAASRQRDLYLDVDRRLQSLEQSQARSAAAPPTAVPPGAVQAGREPAAALPVPAGTDQESYQAAFDLLSGRRYQEAANAFSQFLSAFPGSPLADNAQYWLAETYYVQRDFAGALAAFQKVIGDYPESAKLPDALLKVGYCNYELKRPDAARTALQRVTREYPDTTAARLASQRLELMARETR